MRVLLRSMARPMGEAAYPTIGQPCRVPRLPNLPIVDLGFASFGSMSLTSFSYSASAFAAKLHVFCPGPLEVAVPPYRSVARFAVGITTPLHHFNVVRVVLVGTAGLVAPVVAIEHSPTGLHSLSVGQCHMVT